MKQKPNFIVIHSDQHRADCIGINRQRKGIYTPNIDSVGYQGANLASCYAACPLCIPQRLSLLTGQKPEHHGILGNVGIPHLPLETTLPTEMRKGGYQTALVGRTMHTYPFSNPYGFEYYLPGDPSSENKDTTDSFFSFLRDNTPRESGGYYGGGPYNNSRSGAPFHLDDQFHQTKWATNRALEFLDNRDSSRPFMLFVGYYAPHSPLNPPAEYFNRYYSREDLDDPYIADWDVIPEGNGHTMSPYLNLTGEELRVARAAYYGNIAFIDSQIGRLLDKSLRLGNTYVIFTSDHGELLGDHYMFQKNRVYEGASHLPFVISGPDIDENQTITEPVGWHDIMPTILDFAGLTIPESVDGRSMKSLMTGKNIDELWREYIHGECVHTLYGMTKKRPVSDKHNFIYEEGSHYLTDGKIKYIWHITSGKEQLFDLAADRKEQHDLADNKQYTDALSIWRTRMVIELKDRPEGFSDGRRLISGCKPEILNDKMKLLCEQRHSEGFNIAYATWKKKPEAQSYVNQLMI